MGKSFRFNRQYRCNADHRNRMLEKNTGIKNPVDEEGNMTGSK